MNNIMIVTYTLAVMGLFFFVNSTLQSRFKIKITWRNVLTSGLVLIFIFILGGKIIVLGKSSSLIEPELIAPNNMMVSGTDAIDRALALSDIRTALDKCVLSHNCSSEEETENSSIITQTHDLISASENREAATEWLRENSISVNGTSSWRGRYLHHYNTILYPFREVLDGNYQFLLSSQYGLATIMPLFLVKNQPFIVYPLVGLVALLLFGLLVIYKHKGSIGDTIVSGAIFTLIAFTCNVGALRISPGFSFLRYFPVLILLFLFKKYLENRKTKYTVLTAIVALFNSLQFNLLVLLIELTVMFAVAIGRRVDVRMFSLPVVMAAVIGLQFLCYNSGVHGFAPELFGSVGEGQQSLLFTSLILLFPIFALALKFFNENADNIAFSDTEILAYISYGALATYTIAFAGSPQHYVGFLQMACLSIFLIIMYFERLTHRLMLIAMLFMAPSFTFNYLHATNDFYVSKSSFYDYSGKIGHRLYFRTPSNISSIVDEYNSLVGKYARNKKVYFLSKDKIFIENFMDRNLEPKTYDVFTNFLKLSPVDTLTLLSKEGVDFVLLNSETYRTNVRNFINLEKNLLPAEEFKLHSQILLNIDSFAELIKPSLIECSSRYCIYKLQK